MKAIQSCWARKRLAHTTNVDRLEIRIVLLTIALAPLGALLTVAVLSGTSGAMTTVLASGTTLSSSKPCTGSESHIQRPIASPNRRLEAVPVPTAHQSAPNEPIGSATPATHQSMTNQPIGTEVPANNVERRAKADRNLLFGLAVYRQLSDATYPASSTDGGSTWHIDGPLLWTGTAGPSNGHIGALDTHGAFFWLQDGNLVVVTSDDGKHWWLTGFASGVHEVKQSHGTLQAVALGDRLQCGSFQAFLYSSTDFGRTWILRGGVQDVP